MRHQGGPIREWGLTLLKPGCVFFLINFLIPFIGFYRFDAQLNVTVVVAKYFFADHTSPVTDLVLILVFGVAVDT